MKGSRSLLANLLVFLVMLFFLIDIHASDSQQKLHVVTTVAPITNIVQNIVGSDEHVTGIVPNGIDSHTFEPVPTDAKLLANADIIFVNGLDLEIPTLKLAEKVKKPSTPIVHLGNRTLQKAEWRYDFSFPRELGHPNPHLWTNIAHVMRYAEIIRDNLITLNPQRQDAYAANTAAYQIRLKQLDDAIFDCVKSIPKNNRKLVTYHDSFAYFAPRYGMEVIAAVQPSNFSEPGPREVIRVIKQIKHEAIPAIFGSEVFPSKVMEQIARETGAKFIDQLSDDELPASPNNSFVGMMAKNMATMTEALGGNPECVAHINTGNLFP